jgi:GMP synthase-like glutamine amidotransferase
MRTPRNDQLSETGRAGTRGKHVPERRCVVTGEVAPADNHEVGVYDVTATEHGLRHRLFEGVPDTAKVMQWHFAEVKRPPAGGAVLARSQNAAVQTLAIADHAIGTQFHCEFTPQTMAGWSSMPSYIEALERVRGAGGYRNLINEAYPLMPAMAAMTRRIYDNLAQATGLRRTHVRVAGTGQMADAVS